LLVVHSQQTGALFDLLPIEKGHQPRRPLQTISSAQPFFPFGKSSWAFFVSPSKRAQPPKPNHQSPQAPMFCESRISALFVLSEKTEKGAKKMIIEVTPKTTTTRWRDIPIPSRCKNCPYPHVGFTCRDRDGGCLRTDVERLSEKHRIRAEKGGVSC
jgi:hypothetical protein